MDCAPLARRVAIERDKVRDPKAVEDQEQQRAGLQHLPRAPRLFDQRVPVRSGLSFRRGIPFDMPIGRA